MNMRDKYHKWLRRAKRKAYERAICAWGISDPQRLGYALEIRDAVSLSEVRRIRNKIERHSYVEAKLYTIETNARGLRSA